VDGSASDATTDADAGGCPGKAGPKMVSVGTYCIDSTEVTNAQYDAFLASSPDKALEPATVCAFNTSFARKCTGPTSANTAVTCVNWCDAYAYCAWAGKRLCGAIGGGPGAQATMSSAASDQWYHACSNDGTHVYPYGVTYQTYCNDGNHGVGHAVDVGSLPSCLGGYPSLFDMSGNVVEWVDVCNAQTGANDDCFIRGGAWDDTPAANAFLACASQSSNGRGSTDDTKGFRCCGP
jgi:formylglycine-generating enzyme required for sulfatase activity